jgi:hypothetical protein
MELINATRMTVGYTMGLEPSGRELLVVVIKGTFVLPKTGEAVRLHDKQLPLTMADTFTGAPGFSAPVDEADFAPRKRACDVLLVGSARAPEGRRVTRMRAGLKVGNMEKIVDVIGDRTRQAGLTGNTASPPQFFTHMPVSYDLAFGGSDRNSEDEREHDAYLANPVGRGWHKHLTNAWVDGSPLPNIEAPGDAASFPTDSRRPIAFGPLARGWPLRARYAGSYDQQWLDDVFPFLPKDFDERYHQAAPEDQQVPVPRSPMEVLLSGFTSDGPRHFLLPHFDAAVTVFPKKGTRESHVAALDTMVFQPDFERFTMSWRVTRPLANSMHEIAQVMVGKQGREWWQQRERIAFPIPVVMVPMPSGPREVVAP